MYLLDGLHYNKYHVLESLGIYLCTSIQRYPVHCLVRHNLCQFMCLLQWSYMFPTTPILEDWEIMDASPSTKDTYKIWLQDWKKYLDGCSWDLQIPQKAQQIHTLLRPTNYHTSCNLKSANKNLEGARQHPEVVDTYLSKEVDLNRVVGPFDRSQQIWSHSERAPTR